jgi:hypothetical protein
MAGIKTEIAFTKESQKQFNNALKRVLKVQKKNVPGLLKKSALWFIQSAVKLTPKSKLKRPHKRVPKKSMMFKKRGYEWRIESYKKNGTKKFTYAKTLESRDKKKKISFSGAAKAGWWGGKTKLGKSVSAPGTNKSGLNTVAKKASLVINQSRRSKKPFIIIGNNIDYIRKIGRRIVPLALRKTARRLVGDMERSMKRKMEKSFK